MAESPPRFAKERPRFPADFAANAKKPLIVLCFKVHANFVGYNRAPRYPGASSQVKSLLSPKQRANPQQAEQGHAQMRQCE
jgi:hypothetical protein